MNQDNPRRPDGIPERIYSVLVRLYPAPFRDAFGNSMIQVFRSQCDAARARGGPALTMLWLRTLVDFFRTCPKEHLTALPTLTARFRDHLVRKPAWLYPGLLTALVFATAVIITLLLPPFYRSTVTLDIRRVGRNAVGASDPFFLQTEFEKICSKAVLFPVITNLALREQYGRRSGSVTGPLREVTMAEAYLRLRGSLRVEQLKGASLIMVGVEDRDRSLAMQLANEVAKSYQGMRTKSDLKEWMTKRGVDPDAGAPFDVPLPLPATSRDRSLLAADELANLSGAVRIINPAEAALRPTRPNRVLGIFVGSLVSGLTGCFSLMLVWLLKRLLRPAPRR